MTFGGVDLYPDLFSKAAILGFGLIKNHPFVDGNKRIGQAAMEGFLMSNGYNISAPIDEQEKVILSVAAGQMGLETFQEWILSTLSFVDLHDNNLLRYFCPTSSYFCTSGRVIVQ